MESKEQSRRLVEAAYVVLSQTSDRELDITVLNKALFYSDLVALRDLGKTITGNVYIALEQGPVVAHYEKRLVKALIKAGLGHQEVIEGEYSKPFVLDSEIDDFCFLTAREVTIASSVGGKVGRMTASRVSKASHNNPGWQVSWKEGMGSSPKPIDMLIAMQEVIDRDLWLDEGVDEELETAFLGSTPSEGESW